MPNKLPDSIPRSNIVDAIKAFNAGRPHQFSDSTGYDLIHEGRPYPPKAIVGIAASEMLGVEFHPSDFSGGLKSKCFRLLERQGFKIQEKVIAIPAMAEQLSENVQYAEGMKMQVTVNRYERDPAARRSAIEFHGYICKVCDIDMEQVYGELGRGFIHIHHLTPLSTIKENYHLDPHVDLVPVCPNCHAMLHRKNPPFTPTELKSRLRKN